MTQDLSLEQAQLVLDAAIAASEEQGTKMDIAVVDAGGNLKAFARMDGAWLGSIDIATTKARTARYFNLPTEALGELSQPGGPLYGIEVSNGGLITFPGGLPLEAEDGTVIGAIGVSGSTVEDDRAVAEAGVAALAGASCLGGNRAADRDRSAVSSGRTERRRRRELVQGNPPHERGNETAPG